MNGKFLLDTNIVIALFGNDSSVKKNIANAEEVYIAITVVGELYYGAFKSSRAEENFSHINNLACFITSKKYSLFHLTSY